MATIQILRNMGPGASPVPANASNDAELAYAFGGFSGLAWTAGHHLAIADGNVFRPLVGPQRQIEVNGDQTMTAGVKTWSGGGLNFITTGRATFGGVTNLGINGGSPGDVLTKGAAGDAVVWSPVTPFVGVATDATLTGNGLGGSQLGINPNVWGTGLTITASVVNIDIASATATLPGTANNVFLTPLSLVGTPALPGPLGLPVASLNTSAKTVVPAINELLVLIGGATGSITFVGSYNAATDVLVPVSPAPPGMTTLPAASAANAGWFVIVTTGVANGSGNQPTGPINQGDWLVSGQNPSTSAYAWHRLAVGAGSVLAQNVGVVPPVNGQNNVQTALENLNTTKLATVNVDGASILGNGTAGVANQLRVNIVDGGTF